ncbi:MAG: flagellar basal body P-ring formation chaperone FlgA [Pirellulaceae bacterium]|nr:flagellar basal body P-ring formation chaperone FlgA [Pirellulaceae bacterium]MDP7016672.1 flagellar basal body P-ring formation chaperone FlgA [Pirellulaceae bacterium]
MQRTWLRIVFYFSVANALALWGRSSEIELKANFQVKTPIVRLGDIATFDDAESGAEVARLKRIKLIAAPLPGTSRTLHASQVRELMELAGVNMLQHRMSGATRIRVVNPRPTSSPVKTASARSADGQQANQQFVVTNGPLRKGSRINQDDVRLTDAPQRPGQSGYTKLQDVIGMEVAFSLGTNQIVQRRNIRRPIVVRRSEHVTLFVRSGPVRISTVVMAMQDGAVDDVIKVKSLSPPDRTKRFVRGSGERTARVVGPLEVEILAAGAGLRGASNRLDQSRRYPTPGSSTNARTVADRRSTLRPNSTYRPQP